MKHVDPTSREYDPGIHRSTLDSIGEHTHHHAVVAGMARMGVRVKPLPTYDWHMGPFQMCWRDASGRLHSTTDPRRAGKAAGF